MKRDTGKSHYKVVCDTTLVADSKFLETTISVNYA